MKAAKGILERILKIITIIMVVMGIISSILFMKTHIKMLPINFSYSSERTLFFCMCIVYLISSKFKFKCCKRIAAVGLIINIFNLLGFRIIIKLFSRG